MTTVIVKDVSIDFAESALLVRTENGDHYVVSRIDNEFSRGRETMAFAASPEGEVLDWKEAAGGRGYTVREVIEDIDAGRVYDWFRDDDDDR